VTGGYTVATTGYAGGASVSPFALPEHPVWATGRSVSVARLQRLPEASVIARGVGIVRLMSADFDVPADRGSARAWSNELAEYLGTARIRGLTVQRWNTRAGVIALVWSTYDGPPTSDLELGEKLRGLGVGAGLRAMPHLGIGGPALRPVSIPGVADAPEVAWDQLAEALGQPLPYWPIPLQQRQLIDA
jgi:hypothetical protein